MENKRFEKQLQDLNEINKKLNNFLLKIHTDYGNLGLIGLYEMARMVSEENLNSMKNNFGGDKLKLVILIQKLVRETSTKITTNLNKNGGKS